MLYRIKTDISLEHHNTYVLNRVQGKIFSIVYPQYEALFVKSPEDPDIPKLEVKHLKQPADTSTLATELVFCVSEKSKGFDIGKQYDFRTILHLPLASERFKEFIEEVDPDVHQFYPVTMYSEESDKPIEGMNFYYFICGRLLEIEPVSRPLLVTMTDMVVTMGTNSLRTIVEDKEIQEFLEKVPLWGLLGQRNALYANSEFIKRAQSKGLKGFREAKVNNIGEIEDSGDVQHVWYS